MRFHADELYISFVFIYLKLKQSFQLQMLKNISICEKESSPILNFFINLSSTNNFSHSLSFYLAVNLLEILYPSSTMVIRKVTLPDKFFFEHIFTVHL